MKVSFELVKKVTQKLVRYGRASALTPDTEMRQIADEINQESTKPRSNRKATQSHGTVAGWRRK